MLGTTKPFTFHYSHLLPPIGLQNDRVKLVLFSPARHTAEFIRLTNIEQDRDLYCHLPYGPFKTADEFNVFYQEEIESNPSRALFAIIDKTWESRNPNIDEEGCLAGIIGLRDTRPNNLSCEVGYLIILHPYRSSHVLPNAVGLLLHWCLDLEEHDGLSLRRVAWKCSPLNQTSCDNAVALGFIYEGALRWDMLLNSGPRKGGNYTIPRTGDPKPDCPGRDTAVYSIIWEDWDSGLRQSIDKIMEV